MSDSDKPLDDVWDDFVERQLRGELTGGEQEQLAGWLDSDASLRKEYVARVTWDTELSEVVRCGGDRASELETLLTSDSTTSKWAGGVIRILLAVAAVTILALSFALFYERARPRPVVVAEPLVAENSGDSIAQITGLSGSMIWTGDRGQMLREISVGTQLAGGTIEGLSPDSWFELQFDDGSEVAISGASLLTFSDDGQKRLRLREGRMSADVAPQPDGKPMLIQTRTATLTVLGTSFDVEADLPATALSVREGTVRVTRTSDGKAVDVPANHRVVAAADQDLQQTLIADVVRTWNSRIDQGPDELFGKWIAATDANPAFVKAVAFVPEEAPNVVVYLLGMGVRSQQAAPIQVDIESRFEIRGKIDVDTPIYFGIQVADANGNYAGKFLASCTVERIASDGFVASAGLSDFRLDPSVSAYKDKLAHSPENLFVNGVWSFTHSPHPSGLRISSVQLVSGVQQ